MSVVYVLHPNLDVLASLIGKMRDRGIETVHATDAAGLLERGSKNTPSVLVVPIPAPTAESAAHVASVRAALPPVREVAVPPLEATADAALAAIVDEVTTVLANAPQSDARAVPAQGDVRGDLAQIPLPDLLQLLSMGRKTGTLTVTTSSAAGSCCAVARQFSAAEAARL